jgi:hypothetical protein
MGNFFGLNFDTFTNGMKTNRIVLIVFLFLSWMGNAQSTLKGKIMAKTSDLEGVSVINISSGVSISSEAGGYFTIKAKVNDTLQFTAVQFVAKKIVLKDQDFKSDLFFVNLELTSYELREVKVNKDIDAVTMGILSKPAKKYSPAERKLHEATTGGGIVPLNPILNAISGRTNMLKKEVEVEKKEYVIRKLNDWFEDDYYYEKHKIPKNYIEGFKYFLADDSEFMIAVKSKNKTYVKFLMGESAAAYLQIIKNQ